MNVVIAVCFVVLVVAVLLALTRLVLGPTIPDRIVALDTLLFLVAGGIAVEAARTGESTYLNILLIVSLLGFVGTATAARFVERRGS
jgi:multicomponent Na+:H+ antiporter subunit F